MNLATQSQTHHHLLAELTELAKAYAEERKWATHWKEQADCAHDHLAEQIFEGLSLEAMHETGHIHCLMLDLKAEAFDMGIGKRAADIVERATGLRTER